MAVKRMGAFSVLNKAMHQLGKVIPEKRAKIERRVMKGDLGAAEDAVALALEELAACRARLDMLRAGVPVNPALLTKT
jgi:hypothetical protein